MIQILVPMVITQEVHHHLVEVTPVEVLMMIINYLILIVLYYIHHLVNRVGGKMKSEQMEVLDIDGVN